MQLRCDKNELQEAVSTVLKAISSRTTMPILQCILLQATNNTLTLTGNDLELGIECKIKAEVIENGSIAIESKIFSEIVRKLPNYEVFISVDSNGLTKILCDKSKFNISGLPGNEFIHLPTVEKENSFPFSQLTLKEMIHQTIFSIAMEETRPVLTGELIEVKNQVIRMVSVDGYRVSIRESLLENPMNNIRLIVPGKTLNEINKILSGNEDDVLTIYYTDKHILFEFDSTLVVSRLLSGEFPNYEQIFSKDYETLITIDRKNTVNSLERASLVAREMKKNLIKMEINQEKMIITSNTDLGNVYDELEIKKEGKNIEIAFNPKYLIDALKVIDEDFINVQFTSSLNPCIIRPIEGNAYKYLILPIRLNN